MNQTDTTVPLFPIDSEVMVTVTGRVVYSVCTDTTTRIVVEYLKANGFADRIVLEAVAPGVTVVAAPPPNAAELHAREHAARMVATSFFDPEEGVNATHEWIARFNDAYPPGTPVTYCAGGAAVRTESVTTTVARMYAGRTAVVEVAGFDGPIALSAVTPQASVNA